MPAWATFSRRRVGHHLPGEDPLGDHSHICTECGQKSQISGRRRVGLSGSRQYTHVMHKLRGMVTAFVVPKLSVLTTNMLRFPVWRGRLALPMTKAGS